MRQTSQGSEIGSWEFKTVVARMIESFGVSDRIAPPMDIITTLEMFVSRALLFSHSRVVELG